MPFAWFRLIDYLSSNCPYSCEASLRTAHLSVVLSRCSLPFSHRNQRAREGEWGKRYSSCWSSNVIGYMPGAIAVCSLIRSPTTTEREQHSLVPLLFTQDQVQQPTNAKIRKSERERPSITNMHTPICLRVRTGPKALEELGIGGKHHAVV